MYVIEYHLEVLTDLKRVDNSVRKIHGAYKVKDSKTGFRLIYLVLEEEKSIYVIAVNRRDKLEAYADGEARIGDLLL